MRGRDTFSSRHTGRSRRPVRPHPAVQSAADSANTHVCSRRTHLGPGDTRAPNHQPPRRAANRSEQRSRDLGTRVEPADRHHRAGPAGRCRTCTRRSPRPPDPLCSVNRPSSSAHGPHRREGAPDVRLLLGRVVNFGQARFDLDQMSRRELPRVDPAPRCAGERTSCVVPKVSSFAPALPR